MGGAGGTRRRTNRTEDMHMPSINKKIRKIDVHAHVILHAEYEYPAQLVTTLAQQIALYDELNVEKGVLLPIVAPEAEPLVMSNGDTCYLAKSNPERFYWFCNVDPRFGENRPDSDLSRHLRYFQSLGAKGMGELTANLYADDPLVDNLFSHCAACGMPVTIHIAPTQGGCYGLIDEVGLPRIERMLKKHPQLKLLGHSQPFWAEIDAGVTQRSRGAYPTGKVREGTLARLLREHENLYCDLSAYSACNALTRDPDYAYRFIEEFADRICYGIDLCTPDDRQPRMLASFLDASYESGAIREADYYALCRGNAIRLLGLDDLAGS